MSNGGDSGTFLSLASHFITGPGVTFSLYVLVQLVAAIFVRGKLRWIALIPVLPMAFVAYDAAVSRANSSAMWGMGMAITSPIALVYVLAVIIVAQLRHRAEFAKRHDI
jgi:hypothetical protein